MITPAQIADAIGTHRPTPEQEAVIVAPLDKPLLVVAGAGSGKTETMAFRVLYMIANGLVRPERVLGLTFTRKAAGELRERLAKRVEQLAASGLLDLATQATLTGALPAPAGELAEAAGQETAQAETKEGEPQAEAVEAALPLPAVDVSTYDSFAQRIVREYGLSLGIAADSTLISGATAVEIAHEVVNHWPEDVDDSALSTRVQNVMSLSDEIEANGLELETVREELIDLLGDFPTEHKGKKIPAKFNFTKVPAKLEQRLKLLDLVAAYRAAKAEAGFVDFAKLSAGALKIVTRLEFARTQLQSRYDLVLLDEFQDTSATQVSTFAKLFAHGGVTAVGDPNQAIYGWRGASSGTLEQFVVQFGVDLTQEGGCPRGVRTLSTAWRNDLAILAAANQVAAPLNAAAGVEGDFTPAQRAVTLSALTPSAVAGAGEVLLARAGHQDDEPALVAALVAQQWSEEKTLAVLSRTRAPFPLLQEELAKLGIPSQIVGETGLINTQDVADVRAALALVADPGNGPAAIRLLGAAGLSAIDMDALQRLAKFLARSGGPGEGEAQQGQPDAEPSLAEAIEHVRQASAANREPSGPLSRLSKPALPRVAQLGEQLARLRELTHLALPELVRATFGVLGLDTDIAARPAAMRQRAEQIQRSFVSTAQDYAVAMQRPSLGGFLTWLEQLEESDQGLRIEAPAAEPGVVQILTMHASKGLEWDVVAVCGLAEGRFPSSERNCLTDRWTSRADNLPYPLRPDSEYLPKLVIGPDMDPEAAEECFNSYSQAEVSAVRAEERRLAYVSFTRAKHVLLLTTYARADSGKDMEPSSFLEGIVPLADIPGEAVGSIACAQDAPRFVPLCAPDPVDDAAAPASPTPEAVAAETAPVQPAGKTAGVAKAGKATESGPEAELWLEPSQPRQSDSSLQWPQGLFVDTELEANQALARAVSEAQKGQTPTALLRDLLAGQQVGNAAQDVMVLVEQLHSPYRTQVRLPSRLATTATAALLEEPQEFAKQLRRPLPRAPHSAANLGTAFHQLIEHELKQANLLDLEEESVPVALTPQAQEKVEGWLEWAMAQPLVRDSQVVCVEEEVQLPAGKLQLAGRIDAVFKQTTAAREKYLVVDWKTGRVPTQQQDKLRKAYQLVVYRDAFAAERGIAPAQVEALFVYVSAQQVVRVEDLAPQASTAHLIEQIEEVLA
ncbi:MAG: ATP-dependent DNA helicase [Buchananella hordeovulneris]|nr:ATP-dependent DNA helicase [Buchananella hordeovulneris]